MIWYLNAAVELDLAVDAAATVEFGLETIGLDGLALRECSQS